MKKVLWLDLDYELEDQERERPITINGEKSKELTPYPEITGMLIVNAFERNHTELDPKSSRTYRWLRRTFGPKNLKDKQYIIISQNEFDTVYQEVYDCKKYSAVHAYILPVFLDELDRVKNRKQEEEEKLINELTQKTPNTNSNTIAQSPSTNLQVARG